MIEPVYIRTTYILVTHQAMNEFQVGPCLATAIKCLDPFQNGTPANRQLARNAIFVRGLGSPSDLNKIHTR